MADFHQTGLVSTLHRLGDDSIPRLEAELARHSQRHPIGLLLPALFSEFETPAMERIVRELESVNYLRRIVLALGKADRGQYEIAREFFRNVRTPVSILWMESDRIQALLQLLEDKGIATGPYGKGRTCWLATGFLLAAADVDVIALHDCDILSYDRALLARLCYPLAHPDLPFDFAKGYYARVADRMYGRVTRLFFSPLVRALEDLNPGNPFLRYLDSFRYPLSGEFAMRATLAREMRIPADWGLEVGVLSEVFRRRSLSRVCQVDLTDNYEHKHQKLSGDDSTQGLRRMSREIGRNLFRALASQGFMLTEDHFRALPLRYQQLAEDMAGRYFADACINGLDYDRHAEEEAVSVFAQSIADASHEFAANTLGIPPIPSWERVLSAIPDFFPRLLDAVEQDSREFAPFMTTARSRSWSAGSSIQMQ